MTASPAAKWLDLAHDAAGRITVARDLSVPGYPHVFAIGDTAAVVADEAGRRVPGIAPAAKQMGRYVARAISGKVRGAGSPGHFNYHHQGDLATIGRRAAVVRIHGIRLKGVFGWVFWSAAHIYFLIGTRNRLAVAFSWLWEYFTFQRGARLITFPYAVPADVLNPVPMRNPRWGTAAPVASRPLPPRNASAPSG